ncbi:MAG: M28 family peptidase [Syntrophobacteraceae bacterium]
MSIIDLKDTSRHLVDYLTALTIDIGERNMFSPKKLTETAEYIQSVHVKNGLDVRLEPYPCNDFKAYNVVAFSEPGGEPAKRFLVGAHYDCVLGTVGADDNASAVAVQLEVARQLHAMRRERQIPVSVKFVSFALEEYPAYGTDCMGSRVHAKGMRRRREKIDGMICLEMVGYCCREPGCQKYPLLLRLLGYPNEGNFIAVVGNYGSKQLVRDVSASFSENPQLPVQTLTVPLNGWILPSVRRSDQASFWNEGFKAVMVSDSANFRNWNYHLPSDTMETLDVEFMAQVVESMLGFLLT